MSSGELGFGGGARRWPRRRGCGSEAAVQDADEPVGELAQRGVVLGAAGALGVVLGRGRRARRQGGEGLGHQRVGEPVVADVPGGDDLLLPRRAGDRGRGGVVLAGPAAGVTVRVVAELAEAPGRRGWVPGRAGTDRSQRPGAGEIRSTCPCSALTCSFRAASPRPAPGRWRRRRRYQPAAGPAARRAARRGSARPWRGGRGRRPLERGADPGRVSLAARAGSAPASSASASGASGRRRPPARRGRTLAAVAQPLPCRGAPDQRLVGPGHHLDCSAVGCHPPRPELMGPVRTRSASMCASPRSLFAPNTPAVPGTGTPAAG